MIKKANTENMDDFLLTNFGKLNAFEILYDVHLSQ